MLTEREREVLAAMAEGRSNQSISNALHISEKTVESCTGRIFVNDVGAANWEEINELKPGANYGWPGSEGPTSDPALTNPFYTYPHAGGDADIGVGVN